MSELPPAFFLPLDEDGARLEPTALTRGPWSDAYMHGGPPAALLGGAIARAAPDPDAFVLQRLTVEFLRPLALQPLHLAVQVVKAGRQVQRFSAQLTGQDGAVLASASGLRARRAELALPPGLPAQGPVLPGPQGVPAFEFPFFRAEAVAYHRGVEARIARGAWCEGPLLAWVRPLFPLIAGREASPLERLLIMADAESGVCPPIDPRRWAFPNPDLTVHLVREPAGEWFALDAVPQVEPNGLGLVSSALHDQGGLLGRAAQGLIVDPRS